MSLDLAAAWDETAALARGGTRPIFPIAFLLMALPAAMLQAIAPVTAPGRLPEPGLWLLLAAAMPAASLVGALTISRLALRPGEGVGTALAAGLRRVVPLLCAALLVGLGAVLLAAAAIPLAAALGSAWLMLLPIAVILFFWVRLILLTPVAALEPLGPAPLIRRAWGLTDGSFWRLFLCLS